MQRILLLEDAAALGSGIQLALQGREVHITLCTTLEQARHALNQNPFDLLILDINLPDGSGLASGLLSAAINPLAGRLLENAYWFYRYHYTITPVLLLMPVFALLGYAIPAAMYRQAARQSVVERLREAEA